LLGLFAADENQMTSGRRFPPPWAVEEYRGISYIIRDANNFAVAYVYFATEQSYTRHLMSKDEARTIAESIARLPEMLMRPRD
jgi:hypothetical protein